MQQAVRPEDIVPFRFTLVPAHKPEELHENMRSSIARDLPVVQVSQPHDLTLSIAGGGPSLADTYKDLDGFIGAMNGSLAFLLERGIAPQMCGICDPSPHMVDIIEADPRVKYFVASVVHPLVYDKLLDAGCEVFRWNSSSIPGGEKILEEIEPDALTIGGGSTMGLRWIVLGYTMGFRKFHIHGLDSSFRAKSSHAYPDHQDTKPDWMNFDGYQTRPNFIGQVADFIGWMDRLQEDDVEPVEIRMFGEGLLQSKFRQWKELNPGWHEGGPKPARKLLTDGFQWPASDRMAKATALVEVNFMQKFLALVPGRQTVVQAGGNVGVYPAHLAKHFQHVFTFEPDPVNFGLLSENIKLVKGNIRAFNAALGAEDGTCGLRMPDPTNTGGVFVYGKGETPVRRLDGLGLDSCDLIWLDVEGSELDALKGADDTIARCRPAVIVEETDFAHYGLPTGPAGEWLKERGYYGAVAHGKDVLYLPPNS